MSGSFAPELLFRTVRITSRTLLLRVQLQRTIARESVCVAHESTLIPCINKGLICAAHSRSHCDNLISMEALPKTVTITVDRVNR